MAFTLIAIKLCIPIRLWKPVGRLGCSERHNSQKLCYKPYFQLVFYNPLISCIHGARLFQKPTATRCVWVLWMISIVFSNPNNSMILHKSTKQPSQFPCEEQPAGPWKNHNQLQKMPTKWYFTLKRLQSFFPYLLPQPYCWPWAV